MDNLQIIELLSRKIAGEILKRPNKVIGADDKLISSGLIDSFNLVDLGILVENEFGVRIDDYELNADTFDTIRQLADIIEARK